MALVDHYHGVVLLSQLADLIERSDVTVHGEDAVRGDDAEALSLCLLELLLQVGHIAIEVAVAVSLAEADTVDDGGVIELVGDDRILVGEE